MAAPSPPPSEQLPAPTLRFTGSIISNSDMVRPIGLAEDAARSLIIVAASGQDGITIADASDPRSLTLWGSIRGHAALGGARSVALSRNGIFAYVAANTSDALAVVDTSNKIFPSVIGFVQELDGGLDECSGVAVSPVNENLLYVVARNGGSGPGEGAMLVVSVATKSAPAVVGRVNGGVDVSDIKGATAVVAGSGSLAFFACQLSNAVVAVDVTQVSTCSRVSLGADSR